MTSTRQVELEISLRSLDAEIAQLEQQIRDLESGRLDADIPRLYQELLLESGSLPQQPPPPPPLVPVKEEPIAQDTTSGRGRGRGRGKTVTTGAVDVAAVTEEPVKEKEKEKEKEKDEETLKAEVNGLRKKMEEVVRLALKKDENGWFEHRVTEDDVVGYDEIVLHRVNLELLQKRIERGRYAWPSCKSAAEAGAQFSRDVMLMFANALMFNVPSSEIYTTSVKIKGSVRKHLEEFGLWPGSLPRPSAARTPTPVRKETTTVLPKTQVEDANEEGGDEEKEEKRKKEEEEEEEQEEQPVKKRPKRASTKRRK